MFKWMFLPFKRYAEFSGRSCRKEYWLWLLFTTVVSLVILAPFLTAFFKVFFQVWELAMTGAQDFDEEEMEALFMEVMDPRAFLATVGLVSLFTLATFVPNLALGLRRFHDCGIAPVWYWMLFAAAFVPFFLGIPGLAIFIIAGFVPGNPGPNKFGNDPLVPDAGDGNSGVATATWPTH